MQAQLERIDLIFLQTERERQTDRQRGGDRERKSDGGMGIKI